MARAPLGIACNVYVSEGVEKAVLAKLAAIAQAHPQGKPPTRMLVLLRPEDAHRLGL